MWRFYLLEKKMGRENIPISALWSNGCEEHESELIKWKSHQAPMNSIGMSFDLLIFLVSPWIPSLLLSSLGRHFIVLDPGNKIKCERMRKLLRWHSTEIIFLFLKRPNLCDVSTSFEAASTSASTAWKLHSFSPPYRFLSLSTQDCFALLP